MRALLLPVLLLGPALALALPSRAAKPTVEESDWLKALQAAYVVIELTQGDLNGDGKEEVAVCYVEDPEDSLSNGGLAMLSAKRGQVVPVFHVQFDQAHCDQLKIKGNQIGMRLKSGKSIDGPRALVWTYGDEFAFRGDPGHPLEGIKAEATSTLDESPVHLAAAAIDADLSTSWSEGASGTGIGEELTLTLPTAMRVGAIGILGGRGDSNRSFADHNRLHRASIQVQTPSDMGDESAGIDFADLGIDVGGDRIEFSLENRREVRYVKVDKLDVKVLKLRIDSVYLGNRRDDTHVAEIEVIPLLSLRETVDRAKPIAKRPSKKGGSDAETDNDKGEKLRAPERAKIKDDSKKAAKALDALDGERRSVIEAEF